jgi:hypothetical protein
LLLLFLLLAALLLLLLLLLVAEPKTLPEIPAKAEVSPGFKGAGEWVEGPLEVGLFWLKTKPE